MPSESTLVIAPPDLLPRLVERLRSQGGGELTTCADTDYNRVEWIDKPRPERQKLCSEQR